MGLALNLHHARSERYVAPTGITESCYENPWDPMRMAMALHSGVPEGLGIIVDPAAEITVLGPISAAGHRALDIADPGTLLVVQGDIKTIKGGWS